jgi:hypothetical protein
MKRINLALLAGYVLLTVAIVGCGSSPVVVNKEASTSAIRAAEEVGAATNSNASLYLQLAKEELDKADVFAANGEKERAESMLTRAQTDAELAVVLSRGETEKAVALKALEKVKVLRQDNTSSKGSE